MTDQPNYQEALLINESVPHNLIQKLELVIRAVGLPGSQEIAICAIIQESVEQALYGEGLVLDSEVNKKCREVVEKQKGEFQIGTIKLEDL